MLISELLSETAEKFRVAGIESYQADAELLLAFVLDLSRGQLLAESISGAAISEDRLSGFLSLATRRANREPLQHLTGVAHFRSLELEVGPGVFVPRFETEVVVSYALEFLKAMNLEKPVVVDLATGSGAIALSLATEFPQAIVHAVELSEDALIYTRKNFQKYAPVATLVQGDLADAFPELNGTVDLLVSNPPYIPDEMVPIYPEVHLHDPKLALYGGADGLNIVRKVEATAARLLKTGGKLLIEHADMQAAAVREIFLAKGWLDVKTEVDLAGRDRMVTATRGGN